MPRLSARVDAGRFNAAFSDYYRFARQRAEAAALIATDRGGREALSRLRAAMAGAGLGRLGNALTAESDAETGRGVHRYTGGGFSASSTIYIRSGSDRTRGAIEAYTEGAEILPVRGRWLWFPSDDIQRLVGSGRNRQRLTPALWASSGMERKVGPLVQVRSSKGNPLLIVRNVGISTAGAARSARSLTKKGQPRKGQTAVPMIVAFIGIPRTSRSARVDARAIIRSVQAELPQLYEQALGRI